MSSEQQIVTELDESFSHSKIDMEYPHILIETKVTDPLPVVIGNIEEGDVPVLYTQDGTTYELARISLGALSLDKLLRVYEFTMVKSATESKTITNTVALMEALQWMRQ